MIQIFSPSGSVPTHESVKADRGKSREGDTWGNYTETRLLAR